MFYKIKIASKEASPSGTSPIDMGIVMSAERAPLPSEVAAEAAKSAEAENHSIPVTLKKGESHLVSHTAIEVGVPVSVESATEFALIPVSAFERTEDGKLRTSGSETEGFDAPEDTRFVVAETTTAEDGTTVDSFSPLSTEAPSFTAKDKVAIKGRTDGSTRTRTLFDVSLSDEGDVSIMNRGGAGTVKFEIPESIAEREARVADAGSEAGRLVVQSLIERASKTAVTKEALERADAKRLRVLRREEIKNERPELKAKLSEQKDVVRDAKGELKDMRKAASKRALRRERRGMVSEAMDQYLEANSHATRRERRGMRRGLRQVASRDVANAAAERIARAAHQYNEAYNEANATRRRLHEGSRLYAVGGRNSVAENSRILSGASSEFRGAPGSIIDLEEDRRTKLMKEVEEKRQRLARERYKEMRKHAIAKRAADKARRLHTAGQAKVA